MWQLTLITTWVNGARSGVRLRYDVIGLVFYLCFKIKSYKQIVVLDFLKEYFEINFTKCNFKKILFLFLYTLSLSNIYTQVLVFKKTKGTQ